MGCFPQRYYGIPIVGCPHKEMPGIVHPLYKTESCHNGLQLCDVVIVVATAMSCSAAASSLQQPHHTQPTVMLLLSNEAVTAILRTFWGKNELFCSI